MRVESFRGVVDNFGVGLVALLIIPEQRIPTANIQSTRRLIQRSDSNGGFTLWRGSVFVQIIKRTAA